MMMKSVFWWRKPEYPEETTDLRQVTDETFHTYGLCPVLGLNLGRSGVKQSELRRDDSGALAQCTELPRSQYVDYSNYFWGLGLGGRRGSGDVARGWAETGREEGFWGRG